MQRPEAQSAANADPGDELLGEIERMAALAREGEWPRVECLAATLDAHIDRLSGDGRRETLAAARAGIERLSMLATSARDEVGEQLKAIRHGRKATQSYRTTGAR